MRLYLADMGLFTYQSGLNARTILLKRDNVLSSIYYENFLSTELVPRNIELFYWKGERNSELEFIIYVDSHVIPIDVKKGKSGLNSLN